MRHVSAENEPKNLCVPLATQDERRNQLWHTFATATIAKSEGAFFLISAAHSFADKGGKPAYIFFGREPISLANCVVLKNDEIDIAAIKLSGSIVDKLDDNVLFVTSAHLNINTPIEGVRELEAIQFPSDSRSIVSGYPWNRNTMKTRMHNIGTNGLNITAIDISPSFLGDDNYNELIHIALCYNEKECFDDSGKKISPRNLQGTSGGPITERTSHGRRGFFRIRGIFQRRDKARRALLGLRYEVILAWLSMYGQRFPQPTD
ncbi:MAG: hypothetical protein OXQ89_22000 [Rhodospirillaceae bacterium]|nr:hypothetical protein [Rhodospirillaceae bacterium]